MKKELFIFILFTLIAFLFWGAIALSDEYTLNVSIPIRINLTEANLAVENSVPEFLDIKIRGSGWSILKIKYLQKPIFDLKIDNPREDFNIQLTNLTGDLLSLPKDVKILSIRPERIRLVFDLAVEKKVKIYPRLNVSVKEGYEIVSLIKVEPEEIVIKGTKTVLAEIDSLPTEEVWCKDVSESRMINTQLADTLRNLIYFENIPVRISFDVQQIADRDFEKIPVHLINLPVDNEVNIFPSFVDLKLRGGINILGLLNTDSIYVFVDYNKYKGIDDEIVPEFKLPYGVRVIEYFPKQFKLIVRK